MDRYLTNKTITFIKNVLMVRVITNLDDSLLKPQYRNLPDSNELTGHCYVATETLWHMLSEYQKKCFKPHYLKVNGITHWFLKHDDIIIDPTAKQFATKLNYSEATGCGFLTKNPSNRSMKLLNKLGYQYNTFKSLGYGN